ncbi:MAG: hypothetical protein AB8G77_25615 [Rhodothermales bacterium]
MIATVFCWENRQYALNYYCATKGSLLFFNTTFPQNLMGDIAKPSILANEKATIGLPGYAGKKGENKSR